MFIVSSFHDSPCVFRGVFDCLVNVCHPLHKVCNRFIIGSDSGLQGIAGPWMSSLCDEERGMSGSRGFPVCD